LFAQTYGPAIRAFLGSRWCGRRPPVEVEDAVQEVYLECLREDGVLERAGATPPKQFRTFLLGVVRNVARRLEAHHGLRVADPLPTDYQRHGGVDDASDPTRVFDRTWARNIVRQAQQNLLARLQRGSEAAQARAHLLYQRYMMDLTVAEIAARTGESTRRIHHRLEETRAEFAKELGQLVAADMSGSADEVRLECQRLLGMLGEGPGPRSAPGDSDS
jgi:RNA polymerase sigma-70 factor (ECF subfamily)